VRPNIKVLPSLPYIHTFFPTLSDQYILCPLTFYPLTHNYPHTPTHSQWFSRLVTSSPRVSSSAGPPSWMRTQLSAVSLSFTMPTKSGLARRSSLLLFPVCLSNSSRNIQSKKLTSITRCFHPQLLRLPPPSLRPKVPRTQVQGRRHCRLHLQQRRICPQRMGQGQPCPPGRRLPHARRQQDFLL
jgi:hypothetical protein